MQVVTSPAPPTTPSRTALWGNLISVYLLWGSTYLFIHFMTERMPPLYMVSIRYLIAGSILYGYARLTGTPRPTRREWRSTAILGILLLMVANGCLSVALQYIPSGVAALMGGLLPVYLLTLNWISFGRQRPSHLSLAGLLIGLLGIYLLVKPDKLQSTAGLDAKLIGVGLVAFGNFSWAIGTLLTPRLTLPSGTISSGMQMLVGGVASLILSLSIEPVTPLSILDAPAKAVGSMLYLVVFGSIIGFSSYAWLARHASPQLLSTYAFVNPVVAMLLGTLFANEVFSSQSFIGALVALLGVVLITVGKGSKGERIKE